MAESQGELKKLKIYGYNSPDLADNHKSGDTWVAHINPENYSTEFKVEFAQQQGHGTTGRQASFTRKPPEEISFEFLFDNTGIIYAQENKPGTTQKKDLTDELQTFKDFLVGVDASSHEPRHFKLAWGTLLFKGRCTSLAINYKLFNPDGAPIRAICKTSFKGSIEENLRTAQDSFESPDLTHYRTVKQGDTLPYMCYNMYGHSRYYMQVAEVNKLTNFRRLEPGSEIFFPPFNKTK